MTVILIIYTLALLSPPPSHRDTSASGGDEMAIYPIATQSRKPGTSSKLLYSPVSSTGQAPRRASLARNDKKVIATLSRKRESRIRLGA